MSLNPITREEKMMDAVAKGESVDITPITREEMYLAKASGADVQVPTPITRKEMFLNKIAESGGSAGGGGSVSGGYTVTFKSNGTDYSVVSVTAGQVVNRPTAPKLTGKYFRGWYTEETGGTEVSFPYTPAESVTLYAHFVDQIIVGVTGLTNESGVLTLTDDVAGLDGYTESQNGDYVSVSSPLSGYFPFNEIEEFKDDSGNVFVRYPKLWMKWETDSNGYITGYKFSNGQADDSYFIPDAFLDPKYTTQDTYLPYFALGKYEMSGTSSKGYSKSGATCLTNVTRAQARTAARSYGNAANLYNGYQQLDFAQFTLYNLLCMMFYNHSNIQKVYGGRTGAGTVTSWSNAAVTGTCNGVNGMNGWNVATDCVKMLGIENPYGNINKWVDGIVFKDSTIYAHRYAQQYSDSTANGTALGFNRPTSGNWVKSFKKGTGDKTRSYMYCSGVASNSTYCGDYCYYNSSGVVLYVGGRWSSGATAGLWYLFGSYDASYVHAVIGARLSYRPVNEQSTAVLIAPTLTMNDGNVTFDTNPNTAAYPDAATTILLYKDGVQFATCDGLAASYPMPTDWADGVYKITAKYTAGGYYNSPLSEPVDYVVVSKPTAFKVTINATGAYDYGDVYDENVTGTPTTTTIGSIGPGRSGTYDISSGYLSIVAYSGESYNNGTTGGVTYIDRAYVPLGSGANANSFRYSVTGDGTIDFYLWQCFVEGTNILLADGTTKPVENITYNDKLLVWDFYQGEQAVASPMWIMPQKQAGLYYKVTLSDGTVLKLVGNNGKSHRLYNVEQNAFVYPQDFGSDEHTLNQSGELLTITSIERVEETVNYYNVITDKHYNLYAESILTSCRLSNRYEIKDMRYDLTHSRMTEEEVQDYVDKLPEGKPKSWGGNLVKICFGSNRIVLVGEKWVYKIPLSRRGQKANEQEYEAFLNNIDIVAYSEPRWYGLRQERLHDLVILPRDAGESEVPEHLVPLFRRKLHNRFQVGRTVYGVWKYFDYEDIKFYSRKENESQNYEEKTK